MSLLTEDEMEILITDITDVMESKFGVPIRDATLITEMAENYNNKLLKGKLPVLRVLPDGDREMKICHPLHRYDAVITDEGVVLRNVELG